MGSPGFILKKSNDFVIVNIKNIIVHILDDYGYYYGISEHEDYIFISVNGHIGSNNECFVMYLFDNKRLEDNSYEIAMIEDIYECEDILLKINRIFLKSMIKFTLKVILNLSTIAQTGKTGAI